MFIIQNIIKFIGILSLIYSIIAEEYLLSIAILLSFILIVLDEINKKLLND
jgi:hypothetical protein